MTPTYPSHHTTTSHVSSVAVLMWNNVVSVGSERYRQLWYSGYGTKIADDHLHFICRTLDTKESLRYLRFPCYSSGLAGNYFGGVCSVPSPSVFLSAYLNMDLYHELQAVFSNFDIFIVFLYGVTGKSDFTWWLVWNLSLRIRLCLFYNFFVEWICPRMNYRTSKKR